VPDIDRVLLRQRELIDVCVQHTAWARDEG
jgi:hypothetical protein